jgi:16S rRNA (uracil1498-N3)-methyltransferase
MTPPLFLVDALPDGAELRLSGNEGRHAARVKRLGVGEDVLIGDGQGGIATCVVAAVAADGVLLEVRSRRLVAAPEPRIVVFQALPKGDRAELAVEVLTELGADEIVPWAAARSIAQWSGPRGDKALDKWRRTAREATKQSRRAWVPTVSPLATTADVTRRLTRATALVLHEDAPARLAALPLSASDELLIVVGPEGGITPDELTEFTTVGGVPVRLGEPVLRTSTAGAAALAAVSVRLGRWT